MPTPEERSTEERVMAVIAEHFGVKYTALTSETRLAEDLGADSLDGSELVLGLEDEFGVDVPDDDAEKIKTVGHAIDCMEKLA